MKLLRNWDNKTWLSSKNYIDKFINFLKKKVKLNKNSQILDIGCGRANIISALHSKYKFKLKPIGIDITKNKNIKRNIIFKKKNGVSFLKEDKKNYDLILLKQTIHFLPQKKLHLILNLAKKRLSVGGILLIFSLKTKRNTIPCFRKMKIKLEKSLKRDEKLLNIIKKNLKTTNESYFNFRVNISKQKYIRMIKSRYISCLLDLTRNEIINGISELKLKYKSHIKFTDTLKCISYKK